MKITVCAAIVLSLCPTAAYTADFPLDKLDLSVMRQGFGQARAGESVTGKPLRIAGQTYNTGIGTHAEGRLYIALDGKASRFTALVGVDDHAPDPALVEFQVHGDGRVLWKSGPMKNGDPAKSVDVQLHGLATLTLRVSDGANGNRGDHANWINPVITTEAAPPVAVRFPLEEEVILTPHPPTTPRLNNPALYGARPGHPFLYRIPATGSRPMAFEATGLPPSLSLNRDTGIISGTTPPAVSYHLVLTARNADGAATRPLTLVSGDKLALTPYMGWNDWYAHYDYITDEMIRHAADKLISTGMADHGYDYVNIDDCWMRSPVIDDPELSGPLRAKDGAILPNSRFPDMKALTDHIHQKGLKAGIYTSPGSLTCGKFAGSLGYEEQDARTFADWGFDLVKYDWCSYGREVPKPPSLQQMIQPYADMGKYLRARDRDIIYNLCQYGMGNVWEWGAKTDAQSWRTAGDVLYSLDTMFDVVVSNCGHRAWNGPGEWNDPDYIMVGYVGKRTNETSTRESEPIWFSPTERYAYMSMWSLMAAPLIFSGDMSKLDDFTLNILCNPEVIEINQDPLGQCAAHSALTADCFLLVKDMSDGSKAVGLCNGGETTQTLSASWSAIGVTGPQRVRDVWRHSDIGTLDAKFTAEVPRKGVMLIRVFPN